MNRLVSISLPLIVFLSGYGQYYGGNDDGFDALKTASSSLNNQIGYCNGGTGDGYRGFSVSGYFFDPALTFSGGIGDGFSPVSTGSTHFVNQEFYLSGGANDGFSALTTGPAQICDQSIYVSGGVSDGFNALSIGTANICDPSLYATGGAGDGFNDLSFSGMIHYPASLLGGSSDGFASFQSSAMPISPNFYCYGGANDGAISLGIPATYIGNGIWLGTAGTAWENPANWSGNAVPDLQVHVLIPEDKTNYPLLLTGNLAVDTLSGSYFCKSLTIKEGGMLLNKSNLLINGVMTISGLYQADDAVNHQVIINPGGSLKVASPGQMTIGSP